MAGLTRLENILAATSRVLLEPPDPCTRILIHPFASLLGEALFIADPLNKSSCMHFFLYLGRGLSIIIFSDSRKRGFQDTPTMT